VPQGERAAGVEIAPWEAVLRARFAAHSARIVERGSAFQESTRGFKAETAAGAAPLAVDVGADGTVTLEVAAGAVSARPRRAALSGSPMRAGRAVHYAKAAGAAF